MANQQGDTPQIAMETITLSGEDGTTHIYTMDNTQIIAGLSNVVESTAQEVLVENDGNVLYFVQAESEDMQGVSYVVVDEQGNPSEAVNAVDMVMETPEQGQMHYTEMSKLEFVPEDTESAISKIQDVTSSSGSTDSQIIAIQLNNVVKKEEVDKESESVNEDKIIDVKGATGVEKSSETKDEPEDVTYVLCCHCCGEALETIQELKDHLLECHDISDNVEQHEESLIDDEKAVFSKCVQCGDVFIDSKDLEAHVASEHAGKASQNEPVVKRSPVKQTETRSSYKHKCQFCEMAFDIRSDLELHMEAEHDTFDDVFEIDTLYHKCPYCSRLYLAKWSNKSLSRHMKVDHPGEDIDVEPEVVKVKDKRHLRKLKSDVGTEVEKWNHFPCKYCPKTFIWQKSLARHMRLFHNDMLEILSAEERRKIIGKERIKNKNEVEYRESLNTCPYCSKVFTWRKSLKRHVFDFHRENMDMFEESQSDGRRIRHNNHLLDREHVYFRCIFCSLVSKYTHSIKNHMKRKHFEELEESGWDGITLPTVDASSVGYKVKENDRRPREERLNDWAVVFHCPMCSYATNNASNLQRHMTSRVHNQDKHDLKMASFKRKQRIDGSLPKSNTQLENSGTTADKTVTLASSTTEVQTDESKESHTGFTKEKIQVQKVSDIRELCKEYVNLKVNFKCPDCSDKMFHYEALKEHYESCHLHSPFTATEDSSLVAEPVMMEIKSLKALECPFCDLILSQTKVLEQHISLNHQKCVDQLQIKQEPIEGDTDITDVYKQDGTLLGPVITKSVITAFRCHFCICVFPEVLDLVKHMGIVHPGADKSGKGKKRVGRKRKIQETTSKLPDSKEANTNTLATVQDLANKCPYCPFSCRRATALTFHISFNHAKIKQEEDETPRKKAKVSDISNNAFDVTAVVEDGIGTPQVSVMEMSNKTPGQQPRRRGRPPGSKKKKNLLEENEKVETNLIANLETAEEMPAVEDSGKAEEMFAVEDSGNVVEKGKINNVDAIGIEALVPLADFGNQTEMDIMDDIDEKVEMAIMNDIDEKVGEKVTPKKENRTKLLKTITRGRVKSVDEQPKEEDDILDDIDVSGDDHIDVDYEPMLEEKHAVTSPPPCLRHTCPYCDSGKFLSLRFLEKHVKRVHPSDFKTFSLSDVKAAEPLPVTDSHKCSYCKKGFPSQKAIHEHVSQIHKFVKVIRDEEEEGQGEVDLDKKASQTAGESNMEMKDIIKDEDIDESEMTYKKKRYRLEIKGVGRKTKRAQHKMKSMSGSVCYKCKYCCVFFSTKHSVIRHSVVAHPQQKKLEYSEIEPFVNETEDDLENTYKCPYCDKSSTWKKCIVRHVRALHPKVTDFTSDDILIEIDISKERFKTPEVSQFQCPFCDAIIKWRKSMIRHIRSLHPDQCKGIDLQTMNLEMKSSSSGQTKNWVKTPRHLQCPECKFKCRVIQKMRRHFKEDHPMKSDHMTDSLFKYSYIVDGGQIESSVQTEDDKYIHKCHLCQTSYVWKKSLVFHMRSIHPDVSDVFDTLQNIVEIVDKCIAKPASRRVIGETCDVCNITFKTKTARRIHILMKHRNSTRLKGKSAACGVCKKLFSSRLALAKHKACHHLVKAQTRCSHCGKQCSTEQFLVHHKRTCQKLQSQNGHQLDSRLQLEASKSTCQQDLNYEQPSDIAHQCRLCGAEFLEAVQLKEHLMKEYRKKNWHLLGIYRKVKTYSCQSCDQCFRRPTLRDQHIAEKHKDKTNMCEICGSIFATIPALRRHCAKHGEDGGLDSRVDCNLCGTNMIKRNLNKHYAYKHPDRLICECNICLYQADGPTMVACDVCCRRFCGKRLLYAHRSVEHQKKKYKCKYCSKMFFTSRLRYLHLHKHHGKELSKHLAAANAHQKGSDSKGGEALMGDDNDSTHIIHIGDGQGVQYLPKLSESSLSAVIKELMIVSSDKSCKMPYKCLLCGRCFAKTKYIRLHIRRSHVKDEDQPYRCKVCGSGFVRLTEFRKHSRSHSGFRPYKCKICSKAFKQQANLMDHMNIHNETKNYQCFICKRLFRQRGSLNAHIIHHDKLKPFKCIFCDKGFTTRGELSRHMQHYDLGDGKSKDTRSFMCHICQESFSHFPILLKHIEERHPERPFQCLACGEKFAAFISLYTHKLKNEHFLINDLEPEVDNAATSHVRKIRRSTRDVRNAVYTIAQSEVNEEESSVKHVNDSMFVIQPIEMIDDQVSGTAVEVVIEQYPSDEGREPQNENEELLSIAKQLTELSTYTENEPGETENEAMLQEEDEIIKDMLDADQDLLDNIGKQLAARGEEETISTVDSYNTGNYANADRIKVSQGVDMIVNLDGTEQSEYVIENVVKDEVVTEEVPARTIPNSMEELATLIAQNSQLGLGESVTAYQTEDGSIVYVCMDNNDQVEEAGYEVPAANEYQEPTTDQIVMKDVDTHEDVQKQIVLEEQSLNMQEVETDRIDDEETTDNVVGVGDTVVETEDLIVSVKTETEIGQSEMNSFTQDEEVTGGNQDYNEVAQKVVEYMQDEQTFIQEELIDNNYAKCRIITESGPTVASDSKIWRYMYDDNIYKCSKCDYTCSTRKNMNKHLTRHTPLGNRQHICQECDKRFVTKHELMRHTFAHTGERRHQCKFCTKRFKQPGHLQEHERIHLGQKDNQCSDCPARFITRHQLKSHWQRAHSQVRSNCDECGKSFSDKFGLLKHKGAVHSAMLRKPKSAEGTGPHQCDVCGSSFEKKARLREHMLQHKPESERQRFICELCGEGFKANHLLSDHRSLQHSDETPEICEFCGETFKLKKQLNVHIRRKHRQSKELTKKIYHCGCGKQFSNRNALSYHIGTREDCGSGTFTVSEK